MGAPTKIYFVGSDYNTKLELLEQTRKLFPDYKVRTRDVGFYRDMSEDELETSFEEQNVIYATSLIDLYIQAKKDFTHNLIDESKIKFMRSLIFDNMDIKDSVFLFVDKNTTLIDEDKDIQIEEIIKMLPINVYRICGTRDEKIMQVGKALTDY